MVGVRNDTLSTMTQFMTMSVATTMTKMRYLRSPEFVMSQPPLSHRAATGPLTSQTALSARVELLLLARPDGPPPGPVFLSALTRPVATMKGTPSSLETLLWVYHFHSSTEVRLRGYP